MVPDTIDLSGDPDDGFDGSFWTNYGDLLGYLQGCCGSDDVDLEIGVLPQSIVGCWGYGGGGWFVSGIGCGGTYAHEAGHAFGLTQLRAPSTASATAAAATRTGRSRTAASTPMGGAFSARTS